MPEGVSKDDIDDQIWVIQCDQAEADLTDPNSSIPSNCLDGPITYGEVPANGFEFDTAPDLEVGVTYDLYSATWVNNGVDPAFWVPVGPTPFTP